MRAISEGNIYDVCDDVLKTYDNLPAQAYRVVFSQNSGFHLELHSDMEIKEDKVYGIHNEKIQKVIKSFECTNRNLGVILSGDKGIGKSLFARMLSIEMVQRGYPLIIVEHFIPGIAQYLESIKQEVVVLFDEFDKTFAEAKGENGKQATMLSLFDGIDSGKRLFVVTCNELYGLNSFIVNRPGRFHYHFRFEYPTYNEVKEYLHDKLDEKYHGEIDKVAAFSRRIDLNYDCLRAIAFELNMGYSFEEAIKDLNIIHADYETYDIELHFTNGVILHEYGARMDLFDKHKKHYFWLTDGQGHEPVSAEFSMTDVVYDQKTYIPMIPAEKLKLEFSDDQDYDKDECKLAKVLKEAGATFMVFKKRQAKGIHYAV